MMIMRFLKLSLIILMILIWKIMKEI